MLMDLNNAEVHEMAADLEVLLQDGCQPGSAHNDGRKPGSEPWHTLTAVGVSKLPVAHRSVISGYSGGTAYITLQENLPFLH